jgi:hypothetical protein
VHNIVKAASASTADVSSSAAHPSSSSPSSHEAGVTPTPSATAATRAPSPPSPPMDPGSQTAIQGFGFSRAQSARPASISPHDYHTMGAAGRQTDYSAAASYMQYVPLPTSSEAFAATAEGHACVFNFQRSSSSGPESLRRNLEVRPVTATGGSKPAPSGFDCYNGKVLASRGKRGGAPGRSNSTGSEDQFGRVTTY